MPGVTVPVASRVAPCNDPTASVGVNGKSSQDVRQRENHSFFQSGQYRPIVMPEKPAFSAFRECLKPAQCQRPPRNKNAPAPTQAAASAAAQASDCHCCGPTASPSAA